MRAAVLLSEQSTPDGRSSFVPANEACALALGLSLDAATIAIHAGSKRPDALQEAFGYGIQGVVHLTTAPATGIVESLRDYLLAHSFNMVLTGIRSAGGAGSGLLPYMLAETLNWPLVCNVISLEPDASDCRYVLSDGPSRAIHMRSSMPAIVTVSANAPAPSRFAAARAMRGVVKAEAGAASTDPWPTFDCKQPWRPPTHRYSFDRAASARERLLAATSLQAREGELHRHLSSANAASLIIATLSKQKLLDHLPEQR